MLTKTLQTTTLIMKEADMGRPRLEPSMPQYYRLKVRIIEMAQKKAAKLGLTMPGYISQLIVKDSEGG